MRRLSYLWPYLRPHRRRIFLGMASILASVLISLMGPLLVGSAIDAVRREVTQGVLLGYAGLLVGIAFGQGVFSYLQRMILVSMSRDVEFEMRNAYFGSLEKQPPAFFHDHPTGDLMARATNDLQAVRMVCGPAMMYGANTLITGIGCLFFMLRIDVRLTAISLVATPLVVLSTIVVGRRVHGAFSSVQGKFSEISARVQESLAGVRVVRAYAQEAREEEEFRRVNQEYLEGNRRLAFWSTAMHPLLQMLIGLGFAAVLWYGGLLVIRGGISVGEFVSFNLFLTRLIWPVIALGWVVNLTQRGLASLARIRQVLDTEPAIRDLPGHQLLVDPGALRGDVSFRDLTFSYAENAGPVLRGIDLQVAAGKTVAVVGRTGSGKSTLLSLIPRLIDPPDGALFVDGTDVRRLPLARLRSATGMVPQETFLFSATVLENIAFGRPEASREEVAEAARLAGLESDLAAFPAGLDTVVGERGLTLSGGQKQRVALARALLREPRILLLDDCLSAVDTQTEEQILRNLRTVFRGRTVFLVSHRISTVKDADVIVVLDQGRISERGTHPQLIATGGLYGELHQRQLLEEELAAV